ncbi:Phage protein [Lactococcus lactis subsp. lactis]|nr:DUF1642 domain-containing protein [Lactococcus lactis]KSU09217.1 Phage protein [Lactococcus lactis subsp. lactis]
MTKFEEEFDNKVEIFHVIGDHNSMCCEVEQVKEVFKDWQPQQALPVVPEFVDRAIKYFKKDHLTLYGVLNTITSDRNTEIYTWVFSNGNQELFALAFITGKYEVEKPQLFEVKMPIVYWDDDASQLTNGFDFLRIDKETDEVDFVGFLSNTKKHTVHFTEQEIKSIDERYWQFAVPVEDGE